MPPKAITSYFAKVPPVVTKAAVISTSPTSPSRSKVSVAVDGAATITNGAEDDSTVHLGASTATITAIPNGTTAHPVSSPMAQPTSSQSSTRTKRFLSDAARKAILEAAEESPVKKKQKLDSEANGPPVADLFKKVAQPSASKSATLPKASSKEDLRKSLEDRPELKELLRLEVDTLGEDWMLALQDEFTKPYFKTLKEFVTREQAKSKVFPPADDIYSWSRLCPLKDIRVVIIGQDPYHDDGQAHGLAFSVRKGMRIPPSLRNIYKEMADEIPGFVVPKHGDLTEWAKHGVLLLNTSLTVRAHEAASHSNKGWETFTAVVLKVVTSRLSFAGTDHVAGANGVCFMAWGNHAQKMCAGVDTKKHLVLKSVHPSPLAASRGFFGCGHFKKANEWLQERYGPDGGIDWASLGAGSA